MNSQRIQNAPEISAIDAEALLERCLGRLDLVEKVLGRFQQAMDDELVRIEEAMRQQDVEGIARIAHRIKGTSLTVSAQELHDCAQRLEDAVKSEQQSTEITNCVSALKQECVRLNESITKSRSQAD